MTGQHGNTASSWTFTGSSPRRTTAVLIPARALFAVAIFKIESTLSKFKNADVGTVSRLQSSDFLAKIKDARRIRCHHLNGLVHIHVNRHELRNHRGQIIDAIARGHAVRSVLSVSGKNPCARHFSATSKLKCERPCATSK